jgi:hypothetical protein
MRKDEDVFVAEATKQVKKFMIKKDKITDISNGKILEFLNQNGSYLYCKLPFDIGEEHYMVYARKKQFTTKVFTKFLDKLSVEAYDSDGKKLVPSVNFVVGKSPSGDLETYLDYLQREASEISYSKGVRDSYQTMADEAVSMYGAKTYKELSATSQ